MTDLVSGASTDPPTFWNFAYQHLTAHEKERFTSLRHVWTDRGKGRALIRAALNERALERYVLIWLSDPNLNTSYESGALMRNDEVTHLLSSMAAGLSAILFAISVDCPELNVPPKTIEQRPEPVIAAPIPVGPRKKTTTVKRQIISFDDDAPSSSSSTLGVYGSAPKSLSSLCIKIEEPSSHNVINHRPPIRNRPENIRIDKSIDENLLENGTIVNASPETPTSVHMFSMSHSERFSSTPESILTPQSYSSGVIEASEDSIVSSYPSQNSSIRGSTSSTSESDIVALKARLAEQEERCSFLEARVAELSLENYRLKGQNNSMTYFTVSVPRVLVQKTGVRKFYAYEVHIIPTHGGDEWTVLRRYSDFYRLHKKYQKDNVQVQTLDFPPKKKFGNMNAHFVEQRRQRLQVYLRHLITILPDVSSCSTRSQLEQIFPFL